MALRRRPLGVLAGSAALYLAARQWGWNLPTYPDGGVWYFNPFTWQFLFVLGASLQFRPDFYKRDAAIWEALQARPAPVPAKGSPARGRRIS